MESQTDNHQEPERPDDLKIQNEPEVLRAFYQRYRDKVIEAVKNAGGSASDGATFFRVALLQLTIHESNGVKPFELPVSDLLKDLAVAHYVSWKKDMDGIPASTSTDTQMQSPFSEAESRQLRQYIKARRNINQLEPDDQKSIMATAQAMAAGNGIENIDLNALSEYKTVLGKYAQADWDDPLPTWVVTSLTDPTFNAVWDNVDRVEQDFAPPVALPERKVGTMFFKFLRFALLVLSVGTLGYILWIQFFRPKTAGEVYQANFNPPPSIVEDLKRFPLTSPDDSMELVRPPVCDEILAAADQDYKAQKWRNAAMTLGQMLDSDQYGSCQSEALFYIGIIGLKTNDPYLTLECLAKIEDLERFGEDMYWYQALAYVRIAATDPSEREFARDAVDRAMSNTELPERREQCEKMLKQL